MIWDATALLLACVGLAGLLAAITYRSSPVLTVRELLLPTGVKAEHVAALMRHVAAVREGPVCLTVRAVQGRVRFLVAAPTAALQSIEAATAGLVPEALLEEVVLDSPTGSGVVVGARVGWAGPWPLLRTGDPKLTTAALLGVMANVAADEQLELLLRLWPAGKVHRPVAASDRRQAPANPWFMRPFWPAQPPREEVRLVRAKYSGLLLRSELIVSSEAPTNVQASAGAQRVIAALRSAAGARGVLTYRTIRGRARLRRAGERRRRPFPWQLTTLLSPEELACVAGLPIEAPAIAGISYGVAPRLLAPSELPTAGRVFATSNFPASLGRPLAQPLVGGLQHLAAIGATGSGKTALIGSLIGQDARAGRGAFVLDLKGDLVEACLARLPQSRESSVVVLEPARGGAQPGLELFPAGGDPELTSDLVLGTLQALFHDSWGIRSSQYLGLGLRTLATMRGATLVELPLLFTDAVFRRKVLGYVSDPWIKREWQRFLGLSAGEQAAHLSSPLTKISELVGRGRLRLVLGQSHSKLDFREVLADKRIVLVSLPPGLLGMPATRLLAALTLWQFFQAVEGRAALAPEARSPFFAYVDEVAVLGDLPLPLESIFERARSHSVGLSITPQALSQLTRELRASVLANVGTLVAFGQHSEDEAGVLARALPGVTASQLQHLGQYEVAMRLSLGPGLTTATMTGRTVSPGPVTADPESIRATAARRWGAELEAIDAALARRHGLTEGRDGGHETGDPEAFGVARRRP